jgi:citrate lyase alpha subunit
VERIVGGPPEKPRLLDVPVAVIKWVDGTVLDTVWQVADEAD